MRFVEVQNGSIIDGKLNDSYVETTTFLCPTDRPVIGTSGYHLTSLELDGAIEDVRVTIGEARYTEDFSLPTTTTHPVNG